MTLMHGQRRRPDAFVVGDDDDATNAVVLGIQWLLARDDGELLVLVPQKSQFHHRTILHEVIGEDVARGLGRGRGLIGNPPRAVYASTLRGFPPADWPGGSVLALWADPKMLGKLDQSRRVTAVCAVPWSRADEVAMWASARGAVDLSRPNARQPEPPTIHDPVVEVAMRGLTTSVNLSSVLLDPRDRAYAIGTFRVLQAGGHGWDPDEIKTWALANGWEMEGAERLREYAIGVQQGRRYRTDRWSALRAEALDMWRNEAEGNRDRK
jgi:hypothetical protein